MKGVLANLKQLTAHGDVQTVAAYKLTSVKIAAKRFSMISN